MAAKKSPVDYVKSVITENYINFSGRARRAEYWWFFLFSCIVGGVLQVIPKLGAILSTVFSLAMLLPGVGVAIRRMHDTDHRGWWLLCPVYNFILTILPGTSGSNRFGADPKAE